MASLSLGTDGKNLIKKFEGFCLKFYGDPKGYPTVGWGHLITATKVYKKNTTGDPIDSLLSQADADALSKSLNLGYTSPILQSKADAFFTSDTSGAVTAVNKLVVPTDFKFSQSQFDALVSLAFNAPAALDSSDVKAMLKYPQIYSNFVGPLTPTEIDTCSRLLSKAFSFDKTLQPRRNEEATLFCKGLRYTHKYPVYTL